jgi:hypothetical protein
MIKLIKTVLQIPNETDNFSDIIMSIRNNTIDLSKFNIKKNDKTVYPNMPADILEFIELRYRFIFTPQHGSSEQINIKQKNNINRLKQLFNLVVPSKFGINVELVNYLEDNHELLSADSVENIMLKIYRYGLDDIKIRFNVTYIFFKQILNFASPAVINKFISNVYSEDFNVLHEIISHDRKNMFEFINLFKNDVIMFQMVQRFALTFDRKGTTPLDMILYDDTTLTFKNMLASLNLNENAVKDYYRRRITEQITNNYWGLALFARIKHRQSIIELIKLDYIELSDIENFVLSFKKLINKRYHEDVDGQDIINNVQTCFDNLYYVVDNLDKMFEDVEKEKQQMKDMLESISEVHNGHRYIKYSSDSWRPKYGGADDSDINKYKSKYQKYKLKWDMLMAKY